MTPALCLYCLSVTYPHSIQSGGYRPPEPSAALCTLLGLLVIVWAGIWYGRKAK